MHSAAFMLISSVVKVLRSNYAATFPFQQFFWITNRTNICSSLRQTLQLRLREQKTLVINRKSTCVYLCNYSRWKLSVHIFFLLIFVFYFHPSWVNIFVICLIFLLTILTNEKCSRGRPEHLRNEKHAEENQDESDEDSEETSVIVQLTNRVQDGTRCRPGSLDMCIQGKCQVILRNVLLKRV